MINRITKIVCAFVVIASVSSCSKELSRDEAATIIKNQTGYPTVGFAKCSFSIKEKESSGKYFVKNYSTRKNVNIKELVDQGIFSVEKIQSYTKGPWGGKPYNSFIYELTEKGNTLIAPGYSIDKTRTGITGSFPVHLVEFGEVTGITYTNEDKTEANVDYTVKIKDRTRFTSLISGKIPNQIKTHTVKAKLYDEGWRITIVDSDGMPLPQFPAWSAFDK